MAPKKLNTFLMIAAFLPKYLNLSDPSIFVTKVNNEQVVALSELGGIFYTGVFEKISLLSGNT